MLDIKLSEKIFKLDAFWLRDHCRCNDCYNIETKQRKHNLVDLPSDIEALVMEYQNEDKELQVQWSDGHKSTYVIQSIYDAQFPQSLQRLNQRTPKISWNSAYLSQNEHHINTSFSQMMKSDVTATQVVESLIRYGIALVNGVSPTMEMTEVAVKRLFPPMKTFFGEMWSFSDAFDHLDSAYTKQFLGSHTDNTYFCDAAGVQVLHCLLHENGVGGENFFVDGLYAVEELKRRDPKAYEVLTHVQVPAEYIEEGQYHSHCAPIIRLDPLTNETIQLRLNVYDRALFDTLPQSEMKEFYRSLRVFLSIIQNKECQFFIKLQPGTVVIFDNWRVLHGRMAYTGFRKMTGCYVQRTDFLSKARVMGIID